jgi:hypothetical protein
MLLYSTHELARVFELTHHRLQQLHAQGRGPKRTETLTRNGKRGSPRVAAEDAIAWGLQRIEWLSSRLEWEGEADKYVRGVQKLRVAEFLAKPRSKPKAVVTQPDQRHEATAITPQERENARRREVIAALHAAYNEKPREPAVAWLPEFPAVPQR